MPIANEAQRKNEAIALAMLYTAQGSWNPDNFDDLVSLFKIQHPEAVKEFYSYYL